MRKRGRIWECVKCISHLVTPRFTLHASRDALHASVLLGVMLTGQALAVTTKITRQSSSSELLKGETENVIVNSQGKIQLGRAFEVIVPEFEDVWSINSIVNIGGTLYIGTSPNGGIYKYSLGKLTKIYPVEEQAVETPNQSGQATESSDAADANDVDEPDDPNGEEVKAQEYMSNEHIFAMAQDISGRLLAGISGDKCRLCRFEADKPEVVFEPNDAKYIFAIATDVAGNIFLATGPQGKIYKLDPAGRDGRVLYDSTDKNILALVVGPDGSIYAGSDTRGLIYKINPRSGKASVLYDTDQPEVTALLFGQRQGMANPDLYAAATFADIVKTESRFAAAMPTAGRPESSSKPEGDEPSQGAEGGLKLQIPNTEPPQPAKASRPSPVRKGAKPSKAGHLYKNSKDGFVTDVFTEVAVFFNLVRQQGNLIVGTGNNGRLFCVDPATEEKAIIYEDRHAVQITATAPSGEDLYIGTANPAKLIKVTPKYAAEGTYISDLIDASQPAKWGKLQIEADIPQGCKVLLASRSGNVKDVNDPTFSEWTELVEVTEPIQLRCPLGRFCQYKLVLRTEGANSPLIREVAVASTVPNLAPKVESVTATRIKGAGKAGFFKISFKADDDNEDKLIYTISFRKVGRSEWIELKDELEADNFEWDAKTVEDGRYEIRVVASDERGNTTGTKLTGSRVSDAVAVDNTGPVVRKYSLDKRGKSATLKLQVSDELSAISELHYTVDSNADWRGALPDDFVYDTTDESFSILIDEREPGEHVVAVRIRDIVGNETYKTFQLNILDL